MVRWQVAGGDEDRVMVGSTWEFQTESVFDKRHSFIITVVRLNDKRDKWVCAVMLDETDATQPGQLVQFEETALQKWFKKIG